MPSFTTRNLGRIPAAGLSVLSALLALAAPAAHAGLIGSTTNPTFVAIFGFGPGESGVIVAGNIVGADGSTFTFTDPNFGFGEFMRVAFSDTQITLTNLVSGPADRCEGD